MKTFSTAIIILGLACTLSQGAEVSRMLKTARYFDINTIILSDTATKAGLSDSAARTQIELIFRRNGLPLRSAVDTCVVDPTIIVEQHGGIYVAVVYLCARQIAVVPYTDEQEIERVTTWDSGFHYVATRNITEIYPKVIQYIEESASKLANDWLSVNPRNSVRSQSVDLE